MSVAGQVRKTRIKSGDEVVVIAGKDRGARGKVLRVLRKEGRVLVAGVNRVKKHVRASERTKGGILETEAPIHISNVMFYCPKCERGVRLGMRVLEDGRKVRVCKKCGEVVDR